MLDIHTITSKLLIFTGVLIVGAIISKMIGAGLPAKLFKYNTTESMVIGVGMVPRGEVAMIVALIGISDGFISQDVYVAIVLMSLITTIIPPLIMRQWMHKIR